MHDHALSTQVCVVGAGAAGMWAAEVAARAGCQVLVLEKMRRTGTKVLASGGTKCNLTTTLPPNEAAELFGRRGARFLRTAFRLVPPAEVRARFEQWGVATIEAPLEKIFPATGKATHVRDALERAATRAGARFLLDAGVAGLESEGGPTSPRWRVILHDGRRVAAQRVILCPGGRSYPSTGTTGEGYGWLAALGCEVVEQVPALVPLRSDDAHITELTGIAVQDVIVRLRRADGTGGWIGERERPVLFTHRGVSGPGAMDLSEPVARAVGAARKSGLPTPEFRLSLDLLPRIDRNALRELLIDAASRPGSPRIGHVLPAELPRRLLAAIFAQAGIPTGEVRANGIDKAARHRLVEALKGFEVAITGTLGFDKAEVTAGGLALDEVDAGSLAIKRLPGLFACGEILDLTGPIGGLNFQAAFATAELAARAAVASLTSG